MASFIDTVYENRDRQVSWCGVEMTECEDFNAFMSRDVASRLFDEEEKAEFETLLRSLGNTDFEREDLAAVLNEDVVEREGWAVGEAVAEAFLVHEHNIVWPWNMNRDKRNPKASSAGADLVGFRVEGDKVQFAFGEVKSSGDSTWPPRVMRGPGGMTNQIRNLIKDDLLVHALIRWLFPRCRSEPYRGQFRSALRLFIDSGHKAKSLYGVLIRDTQPSEKDLGSSGRELAGITESPVVCHLFAVYIPCAIAELPGRVAGGSP